MAFNSLPFLFFFLLVFTGYWTLKSNRQRNVLLVLASYFFYGWWDWRFLGLIFISTLTDYCCGLFMHQQQSQRVKKRALWVSIGINIGLLITFKYLNFFIDSANELMLSLGFTSQLQSLNILLPIGISFYTFQTLSYTLDLYRKTLKEPSHDFLAFSAYVCFFPQLVAGPIEKAQHLLPQFRQKKSFDSSLALQGFNQICWGFLKKLVIADNAGILCNQLFEQGSDQNPFALLLAGVFFAFQMYGDIAGYTDIAIGLGKLFGFQLTQNFNFPLFAKNMTDFWNRWHISLSKWFYEYLYFPTIFRLRTWGKWGVHAAIWITFVFSGFWHGANWNAVFWGSLYATYLSLEFLLFPWRSKWSKKTPKLMTYGGMLITITLNLNNWILFRSESIGSYFKHLAGIFSNPKPWSYPISLDDSVIVVLLASFFILEAYQFFKQKNWYQQQSSPWIAAFLMVCIFVFGAFENPNQFIYFQF